MSSKKSSFILRTLNLAICLPYVCVKMSFECFYAVTFESNPSIHEDNVQEELSTSFDVSGISEADPASQAHDKTYLEVQQEVPLLQEATIQEQAVESGDVQQKNREDRQVFSRLSSLTNLFSSLATRTKSHLQTSSIYQKASCFLKFLQRQM
jgi:hypothetical protein